MERAVSSESGQGSVFKVYLPMFSDEANDESKTIKNLENFQGSGERILLVEDEETVREFVTQIFEQNGYIVFTADSVKEAHELFEREEGQFHLLFSDVVLPDGNGLQLAEHLIARNADLRVILSSGYTDQKSQWIRIRKRGFRFDQKPYKMLELLQIVKETLHTTPN